jgi:hypothetical protein
MSLGWLRFFGTSVNKEEKENSCGLRAKKFFAWTKHSSSRLHLSRSKDNVLPDNHANDVGREQELRKNENIWDLSEAGLDWKIQLFGRRESKSRKGKIESGHRTSLLHNEHFFLRIFIQMFLLVYSTIKIRDTTTSSTSSSAMERSFETLSMLSAKTSVSAGHSALQNSWTREWKKKIGLWSTLFSSSPSK